MPPYSIPASLIRQHLFCPRIPFYNEVMALNPGNRPWQKQGDLHHQRQHMLNKRRSLSRYQLNNAALKQNVSLRDPVLGCHGICDALLLTNTEVVPLEFKIAGQKPTAGHIAQLSAYGIMAEQHFERPCKRGFILYGDRGHTKEVHIDARLRQQVITNIHVIQHNLSQPLLPNSSATEAQCGQCEYLNFCGDRL